MSTVVLKVPESIVWAAGKYMFSMTWVETRSHSFFCKIDSLRKCKTTLIISAVDYDSNRCLLINAINYLNLYSTILSVTLSSVQAASVL